MFNRFGIVVTLLVGTLLSMPAMSQERGGRRQRDQAQTRPAQSQPSPPQQPQQKDQPAGTDKLSVTEHELTVGGQPLKYRATAGTLAMKDEAGKHKADVFFVAYEKTPPPAGNDQTAEADNPDAPDPRAGRPVTFVFNGGPGAAAVWLHIGTAGPKRLKLNEDGTPPPPPSVLVNNEQTWLAATDLVFIDPVNTGYSRPAPGEDAKQFFGVENDVRWVADFIRLYLTRYRRWSSPKFLAGESYGTTRAAALSDHLLERAGVSLNGIILVSSVLDFSTLSPRDNNDLPYALFLPSYTSVAGYHKKLPPEMQKDVPAAVKQAEAWARREYVAALAQGDALPADQRAAVAAKLMQFTGLSADVIDKSNLRVGPFLFQAALLENERKVVGRFDGRLTGYDPHPLDRQPAFDPSLDAFRGAYATAFNAYVRRDLKFESDLNYQVLNGIENWDYGPSGSQPLYVADRLRSAMASTPGLKVFFAGGYHDLATPYLATRYTIDHMLLSPDLRANVTEQFYPGGHMMYHRLESLKSLNADVAKFIQSALPR
jgi:carboxypeptidase C (cathepsin A)